MSSPVPPDPVYSFRPRSGAINSVQSLQLSECDMAIACGSSSGSVQLWSLKSKRSLWTKDVGSSVMSLGTCTVKGNARLLCQTKDRVLRVWDIVSEEDIMSLSFSDAGFCKISTFHSSSSKSSCVAIACQDSNKVDVYNLDAGKRVESFALKDSVKGLCMCVKTLYHDPTGVCYLIGGFEDGSVVLWDERNPTAELCSLQVFSEPVMCMSVDNSMRGVAGSVGTSVQLFSVSDQRDMLQVFNTIHLKNPGISDIAIRQDQRIFATGGWDGRIRVFTWTKGKPLAILKYHSLTVNSIHFAKNSIPSESDKFLICGSKDEIVSVWKLY